MLVGRKMGDKSRERNEIVTNVMAGRAREVKRTRRERERKRLTDGLMEK